ncbi:4Fe-4S dicluster domain-containing protein [bacterium]|nr:4Fe-4S dicluster domain-containing protein [bacterium]
METLELSKLDQQFKYEIASRPGGEHFKSCFFCGTCTAACPVADVTEEYSPMRIIRMALLGMKEEVLSSEAIWLCSLCYTCYATCPQDVRFRDVIEVLRDMAIEGEYVSGEIGAKIEKVDRLSREVRREMVKFLFDKDEKRVAQIGEKIEELRGI